MGNGYGNGYGPGGKPPGWVPPGQREEDEPGDVLHADWFWSEEDGGDNQARVLRPLALSGAGFETTWVIPAPVVAATGVRPVTPGDRFEEPLQIFGNSGTAVMEFWGAGPEDDEVWVRPYADWVDSRSDETVWLNYLPAESGHLTIESTDWLYVEIGTGTAEDFAIEVFGDPSSAPLTVLTAMGSPVIIRVRPGDYTSMEETFSLTWAFVNLVPDLVLTVLSDLEQAPGTFRVTVTNGIPGNAVTFTSAPATIPSGTLDDNGALISFPIFITDARTAGVKTLTAASTGRDNASASFTVVKAPVTNPLTQPSDSTPVAVAPVDGVRKWVLQDPAPAGEQYVFEINPDSATSPWPENVFTSDVTTAPDGQHLTWEGARKAVSWSFKGTILTQTQHDAFVRFQALNRRVYLIDNRNRAWVVSIESFDAEPKKVNDNPWAHTYTVSAIIYKGPVTPA